MNSGLRTRDFVLKTQQLPYFLSSGSETQWRLWKRRKKKRLGLDVVLSGYFISRRVETQTRKSVC